MAPVLISFPGKKPLHFLIANRQHRAFAIKLPRELAQHQADRFCQSFVDAHHSQHAFEKVLFIHYRALPSSQPRHAQACQIGPYRHADPSQVASGSFALHRRSEPYCAHHAGNGRRMTTGEFRAAPDISASTAQFQAFAEDRAEATGTWNAAVPGRNPAKMAMLVGGGVVLVIIVVLIVALG